MYRIHPFCKTVLALVLACGIVGGLAACKGADVEKDKKEITDVISKTYDSAIALDDSVVDELLKQANLGDMGDMGINGKDILAAAFKNFKYKVGDIKISDDKAIASVHVSNIDLKEGLRKFEDAFGTWAKSDEGIDAFTNKDADAIGNGIRSALDTGFGDSSLETKEADVSINLIKKDGKWELENRAELFDSMVVGY
ncbi:MAG: hypothetical protein SOU05_05395 [Atopobium sp.]|uniref:hypothetical protein n=1 Tax=Atopobium sp. TaxID=1872650 RepID=UPI002A75F7A9|nr:hypothetical protein [Atopobium sp.]MDY2788820.1 hypothetical protein [Atopobium sp.]